jgi:hypothetical protein
MTHSEPVASRNVPLNLSYNHNVLAIANLAEITLLFAANEEPDDLHQDLANAATHVASRFCIPHLYKQLEGFFHVQSRLRSQEHFLALHRAVTICKRVASMYAYLPAICIALTAHV